MSGAFAATRMPGIGQVAINAGIGRGSYIADQKLNGKKVLKKTGIK